MFRGSTPKATRSRLFDPRHRWKFAKVSSITINQFRRKNSCQRQGINGTLASYNCNLQVVSIHDGGGALITRVRYEFVGSGRDFHREQRIGNSELEWESCPNQYCVRKWQFLEETKAMLSHPVFSDIASQVFGSNRSMNSNSFMELTIGVAA